MAQPINIILASERDVAFCIQLTQNTVADKFASIVIIEGVTQYWQMAPIFQRRSYINVVKHFCSIEPGQVYFVHSSFAFSADGRSLIENSEGTTTIFESVIRALENNYISIGKIAVLKNTSLMDGVLQSFTPAELVILEGNNKKVLRAKSGNVRGLTRTELRDLYARSSKISQVGVFSKEHLSRLNEGVLNNWLMENCAGELQYYKQTWIAGAMLLRAKELALTSVNAYVDYCQRNREELSLLEKSIFRAAPQPQLFTAASSFLNFILSAENRLNKVLCQTEDRKEAKDYRVWIIGAGYGELAYGLYASWCKVRSEGGALENLKVFATDSYSPLVESATLGLRRESLNFDRPDNQQLAAFIDGSWDKGYFNCTTHCSNIEFSVHDLIHTPPLNQIDLIVSCHVLERYKDQYRKQAVSTLHDCLNDDGLLWVMEDGELHLTEQGFSNAALGKFNVFAKSGKLIGDCHDSNAREYTDYSRVHYAPSVKNLLRQHKKLNRHKHYHRVLDLLIDDYMTPGFLLDREGGLVHVIGNIVEYVVPKKHGAYGKDICDMLKSPLDVFLHGSINQVLREKESTSIRIPWQEREGLQTIILNCSVRYFSSGSQTEALLAVLIEKCNKVHSISSEMADSGQVAVVSRLEEDMANLVTLTSQLVSEENAENKRLKQQLESLSYENLQLQEINERLSERYENLIEKKQDAGSVVADVENVKHPA